ncbi:MAG: bacterial Ig-like domain-containing protein, partial [Firmicutes bacterium]|nr:bacterial Ig-like domain-containing protein [Bacillota bacterium]
YAMIYSQGHDLTIDCKDAKLVDTGSYTVIDVWSGDLTITGTLYAESTDDDVIRANENLIINGEVTAISKQTSDDGGMAVWAYDDITVNGKLTAKGTQAGLECYGNLTLSEGPVVIEGDGCTAAFVEKDVSISCDASFISNSENDDALHAENLVINGGKVTATVTGSSGKGDGFDIGSDMTINSGEVTASSPREAFDVSQTLKIVDGIVSGTATKSEQGMYVGTLIVEGGTVTAEGVEEGIYADTIEIKGGEVTATSGTEHGMRGSRGITVSGGTVTATGSGAEYYGIYVDEGTLAIKNGTVKVTAEGKNGAYAVGVGGSIEIGDQLVIREPSGGSVGTSETVSDYVLILDKEGAVSTSALIVPGEEYEISFDANGGDGEMEAQTAYEGKKFELPECGFTAPGGYEFDAWDKGAAGDEITVTENTVIKAQWKLLTLTGLAATDPDRTAYFAGETFDPAGMVVTATYSDESEKEVTDYTVSPDGALTLDDTEITVTYTENDVTKTATVPITVSMCKITFADADGNELQTVEVSYGETPAYTGEEPVKEVGDEDDVCAYTFTGWDPEITGATGDTTYTASFSAEAHTYEFSGWNWTVKAAGQATTKPTYDEYEAAQALFTCKECGGTKFLDATIKEDRSEPSCLGAGSIVYTATVTFEGSDYEDTQTVEMPATGHSWEEEVSYQWPEDNAEVTASHKCAVCGETESETVKTTSKVTKQPNCTEWGETTYTATFKNEAFGTESFTQEDVEPLGHSWEEEVSYQWPEDNAEVTASHKCTVCGETESETVKTTSKVTKQPTCTEWGETTFTATFKNEAFGTDTFTQEDVEPLGHDWEEEVSYQWPQDNAEVTASRKCKNCSETESETVKTTSKVTKQPTCTEWGETTFTATFKNEAFGTDTFTQADIEPLGHDWGSWKVVKEATESAEGEGARTCARCGEKETRVIPKKGVKISYQNASTGDLTYTLGSNAELSFTFKRSVDDGETIKHFAGLQVDGAVVDITNYTTEAGSVIVKVKPAYLDTLTIGTHTLTAKFDDADAVTVNFTVAAAKNSGGDEKKDEGSAPTGDDSHTGIWIALLGLSLAAATGLVVSKKRIRR